MKVINKIPKIGSTQSIKFWSLRNGLGSNLGVIFDIDTQVERKCRRVLTNDGWKWQIVDLKKNIDWDWLLYTDQECLDETGMDMSDIEIVKSNT